MGTACRVFLLDDNDSLQRISLARLERLLDFNPKESLPQYSGKRVRCAMVFIEVAGRLVLSIRKIDHFLLTFDAEGRIDRKEWERSVRLGMELLPYIDGREHKKVINARHRFAKRRYDHEFKWKPSRKVMEAIVRAILGKDALGQGR